MLQVRLASYRNFYDDEVDYLIEILELFKACINSHEFYDRMLNHPGFDTSNNLANRAIIEYIYSGRELGSRADYEADFKCRLLSRNSNNKIGYYRSGWIYIYENSFYDEPIEFLAGFYAHEYCHALGFDDPADLSETYNNVPYTVGDIVFDIASELNSTYFET